MTFESLPLTFTSCAALNGVPKEVVQRADDLISTALKGKDLIAGCSVMPQLEVMELEEAVSYERIVGFILKIFQERIARNFLEIEKFTDPKAMLEDILSSASIAPA